MEVLGGAIKHHSLVPNMIYYMSYIEFSNEEEPKYEFIGISKTEGSESRAYIFKDVKTHRMHKFYDDALDRMIVKHHNMGPITEQDRAIAKFCGKVDAIYEDLKLHVKDLPAKPSQTKNIIAFVLNKIDSKTK